MTTRTFITEAITWSVSIFIGFCVVLVVNNSVDDYFDLEFRMSEEQYDALLDNQETIIKNQTATMQSQLLVGKGVILLLESEFGESFPAEEDIQYEWFTPDHESLLNAISYVESGHNPNAIGDNGNALGMFQIWNVFWQDAVEHDPSIGGVYTDVTDPEYARKIVLAYWDRYGYRVDYSIESLARIVNGGPTGYKKTATLGYWEKVNSELQ